MDPRTLLCSGVVECVVALNSGGFYYHVVAAAGIVKLMHKTNYSGTQLGLQFNIDGLPIFMSSKLQLWPILSIIIGENLKSKPFIVGLYIGYKKPPVDFHEIFIKQCP